MDLLIALAADAVVWLHLSFILFVIGGGALLWRWPRLVLLHVPAVLWGAWVEFSGAICPLTPLENRLRVLAGGSGYEGGFVEHHLLPLIYPPGLTPQLQWLMGGAVVAVNVTLYALWLRRRSRGGERGLRPALEAATPSPRSVADTQPSSTHERQGV